MSTRTRGDWILWGALGCALVGTAHAEYTLATATHVNGWVALAVPGALDLYVIRALQQHRDVLAAVLVMVAANVTSHLLTAGVLPVHWSITGAVGALAPLLLWRVHFLWRVPGAVSAPVPEPEYTAPDRVPDRVPDWMADEYPTSAPDLVYLSTAEQDEYADKWGQVQNPVTYLSVVPPLPPEFDQVSAAGTAPDPGVLKPGDHEYTALAQEYIATTDAPSIRGLKAYASIGQDRAARLLEHLEAKS